MFPVWRSVDKGGFSRGGGGGSRGQTRAAASHPPATETCFLFLFCWFFLMLLWGLPHSKEEIFTKSGVPVCYSAQLMGNPGYIFF